MTTTPAVAVTGDRHWALFADWCTSLDREALPATPDTILAFLVELPAGAATIARRVRAIDIAHRHAGHPPPSTSPQFDTLLRPPRPPRFDPDLVAATLQAATVGGWPAGIVGRRDAALVALVCSAGMTRRHIQALHTGHTAVPALAVTPEPGGCPACALTRWQRAATMTVISGWRPVRNELADVDHTPAGAETSHDCTQPPAPHPAGRALPLFWAIDRHGAPQSAYPLSTRSITAIIAARLAATRTGHHQPPTPGLDQAADTLDRSWEPADHARVLAERKAATHRLAAYESVLDAADAYAEAILNRLDAQLAGVPVTEQDEPSSP